MANQAKVTSTEAIEAFRSNLIVFLTKARRSIDDVGDEVRRTRSWLQHDQRVHWENEFRKRTKALEQAQQDLINTRFNNNSETAMQVRQQAVNKAQRAITEAQEKIRNVKKWSQNFDTQVDPFVKRMENLGQFLEQDMPKGVAYLANVQRILDAYANTRLPQSDAASPMSSTDAQPLPETPAIAVGADAPAPEADAVPAATLPPEHLPSPEAPVP